MADIVGVYDVYRGGPAPSIIDAVQIPVNDPMMVVPLMAAVTEHIGFGVTAFDGADAAPGPATLTAVTMKVYVVAFVSPPMLT